MEGGTFALEPATEFVAGRRAWPVRGALSYLFPHNLLQCELGRCRGRPHKGSWSGGGDVSWHFCLAMRVGGVKVSFWWCGGRWDQEEEETAGKLDGRTATRQDPTPLMADKRRRVPLGFSRTPLPTKLDARQCLAALGCQRRHPCQMGRRDDVLALPRQERAGPVARGAPWSNRASAHCSGK